jgi:hypothetical protein
VSVEAISWAVVRTASAVQADPPRPSNYIVAGAWLGGAFELTLDDVENWLTS